MAYIIGSILMVLGTFVLCVATFGLFRFRYVLNRMHVAAKCDTLGCLLILAGLMISNGWNMETGKIALIIIFIWLTSPVASHMIAEAEMDSNDEIEEECEVIYREDI